MYIHELLKNEVEISHLSTCKKTVQTIGPFHLHRLLNYHIRNILTGYYTNFRRGFDLKSHEQYQMRSLQTTVRVLVASVSEKGQLGGELEAVQSENRRDHWQTPRSMISLPTALESKNEVMAGVTLEMI